MSNNYTQFSTVLSLPSQEAQDYAIALKNRMDELRRGDLACETSITGRIAKPDDIPLELWRYVEEWGWFMCEPGGSPNGYGIWLSHGDETGDPESAALLIQHLIEKYQPEETHWFTWADWCSKPVLDEFTGGAVFITATGTNWLSAGLWAQQQHDQWIADEAGGPIPKD